MKNHMRSFVHERRNGRIMETILLETDTRTDATMGLDDIQERPHHILHRPRQTPDKPGDVITKMETDMMTSGTADEFIERFKINVNDSGVTQDRPLIEWFMKRINVPLLDKILNLENPPTTIIG